MGQKANTEDDFILKLEQRHEYLNHLGTLHAALLFVLAEATSGEYLLNQFKDYKLDIIPVVRKAEIKYSKQGKGTVSSKAIFIEKNTNTNDIVDELNIKKRIIIKVRVDIFNEEMDKLMTSVFDWFIAFK